MMKIICTIHKLSIVNSEIIYTSKRKIADPVAARALIARTLNRGFESLLRDGCLSSSFYVVLSCVDRSLATS
jgi:hypothetical protein